MSNYFEETGEDFVVSRERGIDTKTQVDLLKMIRCLANRHYDLEELGVHESTTDILNVLFDYILDSFGLPEDKANVCGDVFSRKPFVELLYDEFILAGDNISAWDTLERLKVMASDFKEDFDDQQAAKPLIENNISLEQTILYSCKRKLDELEKYINGEVEDVENSDINGLLNSLHGLLDLREEPNHGLSQKALNELSQIHVRSMHLMRKRAGFNR